MEDLRAACPSGVDLQFSALVLHELVAGLDLDESYHWPHPFTPELALMVLRRARARAGHKTLSKDDPELAIRLYRFLKIFDRTEMLKSDGFLAAKNARTEGQKALEVTKRT